MKKNLCKVPTCINNVFGKFEYCRKHQIELETKKGLYFEEMKRDGRNNKKQ